MTLATAAAAALALRSLIEELTSLGHAQMERIESARALLNGRIGDARREATRTIDEAGRRPELDAAAESLAIVALHGEIPQPIRSAAYDAALALLASDLVPPPTFRALYEPWDEGLHDGAGTRAMDHGEEVLFHLD